MTVGLRASQRSCRRQPQFLAGEHVERGEGLVQHQQRGIVDQGAAKRRALLHAPGKLPGKMILEAGKPHESEKLAHLAS